VGATCDTQESSGAASYRGRSRGSRKRACAESGALRKCFFIHYRTARELNTGQVVDHTERPEPHLAVRTG
jgi:hypothetical protein